MYRFLFLCLLCFVGCQNNNGKKSTQPTNLTTFRGIAMTIPYQIEIAKVLTQQQEEVIQQVINATFHEVDQIYNKWNPHSELSFINRLPANQEMRLSPRLYSFLVRCNDFVRMTNGKFDPTIEPIQALWKRHLDQNIEPSSQEIESLREVVGWENIILQHGTITKKHSKTALDLGGIAKGYTVDLLVERLSKQGFKSVFVEWGGEVRATGRHPQGRSWAVYISNLEDLNPEHALAYVPLEDQAIATSGDYLQQWQLPEAHKTYFHIFDPKTCCPLTVTDTSIASATCLAKDCMTADVLATTLLMCVDLEQAKNLAEQYQKEVPGTNFWILSRKEIPKH